MSKLGYQFTDETYTKKEDLKQIYEGSIYNQVVGEVEQYRSLFKFKLTPIEDGYIILSSRMYHRILKLMEQLYRYQMHYKTDIPYAMYPFNKYNFTKELFISFSHQRHLSIKLQKLNMVFLVVMEEEMKERIVNEDIPILVRLMMIEYYFRNHQDLSVLYKTMILQHEHLPLLDSLLFSNKSFNDTDCTPYFIDRLKEIHGRIELDLIKDTKSLQEDSLEELLQRNPNLRPYQVEFYLTHRTMQHFYTLKEFQSMCKVSYETARYSMDELVELGWYRKIKKGKKFLYTI